VLLFAYLPGSLDPCTLGDVIDVSILNLVLAANLVIGFCYGHGVESIRDHAISNKDFTTATLTATIVVSWIGGSDVFDILQHTYLV